MWILYYKNESVVLQLISRSEVLVIPMHRDKITAHAPWYRAWASDMMSVHIKKVTSFQSTIIFDAFAIFQFYYKYRFFWVPLLKLNELSSINQDNNFRNLRKIKSPGKTRAINTYIGQKKTYFNSNAIFCLMSTEEFPMRASNAPGSATHSPFLSS